MNAKRIGLWRMPDERLLKAEIISAGMNLIPTYADKCI